MRDIAERGRPAADAALAALAQERAEWAARSERVRRQAEEAARQEAAREALAVVRAQAAERARAIAGDLEARVEDSLRGSGARPVATRRLGDGLVEVRWRMLGQRFVSVVEEVALRVVDAGICLAGCDALVTLDSLPGVVREAIDGRLLVITHHDPDY
jgi:hypothetical protein